MIVFLCELFVSIILYVFVYSILWNVNLNENFNVIVFKIGYMCLLKLLV